jgi:hypothetical protein
MDAICVKTGFLAVYQFIVERRSEMKGTDMHSEPGTAAVIAGRQRVRNVPFRVCRCQLIPVGGILRGFHAKGRLLFHHECA